MSLFELRYYGDLCPINQKYVSRRFVLSPRYRKCKDAVATVAKFHCKLKPIDEPIKVHLTTYYHREHDIDSFLKFIFDALEGIVFDNDKRIMLLNVDKVIEKDKEKNGFDLKVAYL